jgi:hypothetical protein
VVVSRPIGCGSFSQPLLLTDARYEGDEVTAGQVVATNQKLHRNCDFPVLRVVQRLMIAAPRILRCYL